MLDEIEGMGHPLMNGAVSSKILLLYCGGFPWQKVV